MYLKGKYYFILNGGVACDIRPSHRIIHSMCCNLYGVGPTPRYTPHEASQRLLNAPSLSREQQQQKQTSLLKQ